MSDNQQGNAEEIAQGTGHDREGNADRDREWVRRDELTAVVNERNDWKRKFRQVTAQLEELADAEPNETQREAIEQAAGRLAETERRYEQLWIDHGILAAAEAADAVSGPAVVQLFRSRVRSRRDDDGRIQAVITDGEGKPIRDEADRPMSLAAAVKQFLAEPENAFLIRSRYPGGGGTAGGPRSAPPRASLDQLSAEEVARLSDGEFERLNAQRRRNRQGFRW